MSDTIEALIRNEGWEIVPGGRVYARDREFPLVHPFLIHAKLYRTEKNPESKYLSMKAMHDYLWPETTWHYWTERRFRAHCEGWSYVSYAGGAATTKSFDSAKIAWLFWLANPQKRTVIVASTTLESLNSRIWGYVTKLGGKIALGGLTWALMRAKPPKILWESGDKNKLDTIHGMFAVAAQRGDSDQAVANWIGKHPDEGLLVILDEATDMPPQLINSFPNLEQGVETYQVMVIGNSNSKFDVHGALSTPKGGWESIDPRVNNRWETTQKNGLCLFFSCYESPAIFEKDPERREKLSKFLITSEKIDEKERTLGKDSDNFWRFVVGFWKNESTDPTVVSEKFIEEYHVRSRAEWSGLYPLAFAAGLDASFSEGGDDCILRLAVYGHDVHGNMVLDYRGDELLFRLEIKNNSPQSAEVQVADQVIRILREFRIPLGRLCIDATGQGRALGDLIRERARELQSPIKIYSIRTGKGTGKTSDLIVMDTYDLWFEFRAFIQAGQIRGLDDTAAMQLTTRWLIKEGKKATLESKLAYKARMGAVMPSLARSPDEADAAALCLQSAIRALGFQAGLKRALPEKQSFSDEKYSAFKALQTGEVQARQEVQSPPYATFGADLTDVVKFPSSLFSGFGGRKL